MKYYRAKLATLARDLVNDLETRRLKSMKKWHFDLLGDLVYFHKSKKKTVSRFTKLIYKIQKKIKKLLLIDKIYEPESNIAFCYDSIAAIFIAFWMFIYSMHLFFQTTEFIISIYI